MYTSFVLKTPLPWVQYLQWGTRRFQILEGWTLFLRAANTLICTLRHPRDILLHVTCALRLVQFAPSDVAALCSVSCFINKCSKNTGLIAVIIRSVPPKTCGIYINASLLIILLYTLYFFYQERLARPEDQTWSSWGRIVIIASTVFWGAQALAFLSFAEQRVAPFVKAE